MEYHMEAEYDGVDAASPRFKMALEYTLTDDGLDVRLPANSIAFDETKFTLESISVLPYFGAGSNKYEGYSLLPDGSGTLVTFSDTINRAIMIQGDMYGPDYVYRKLGNLANETFRMPVFGTVTNYDYTVKGVQRKYSSGVFAVITEGDSLSTIKSESGGALHPYTSSYVMFNPRPRDTIKLFSTESGAGASMSVTTTRIFTGSYRIKYTFLIDDAIAKKNKIEDTYSPTWLGMANAYRDYLMKEGILTKLTEEDVKENIPLYIESFGSTTDDDRMFTFPVVVDVPLTTFEDVKTMQSELSSKGISNINFKLKGFYNGGMWPTIPYKLKFDKVVGGDEGFADLVEYAKENDFMVYPDFDLANSMKDENFDGFSAKKHAIRDVSDYICIKGLYDPAAQDVFYFRIYPITPKLISYFYDHFRGEYTEFGNNAISVGTLGTDLNSDFDEDEAYHREDGKEYTMEALAKIDADYDKVMVDGGNAYTMGYADVILGAPTTSSNFKAASYTVPFYGMVFHACKEFAGEPINMEGDVNKAVLNAIESGAGIYFILSYRNTDLLKEDMYYSSYYSVQYEIWKEDIVKYYNILNDATKDLQTSYIVGHEFLYGSRIPDADELEAIEAAKQAEKDAERKDAANAKEMAEREKRLEERLKNQFGEDFIDWSIEKEETETTVEVEAHDNFKTLRGTVVAVEYEGGVKFLLNYNSYDITVKYENKTYTLGALGFERID